MFERIGNGWELSKMSFQVLRLDKELLLFPLISGLACLVVMASFIVPLWNSPDVAAIMNDHQAPQGPTAYLILFAFYAVNYFVIVFFNSALVACAIIRFRGGDPTLADGFRAAGNRLPQIVAWALASATVGMILRVIESRSEKAGAIAASLFGAAWSIATFFVVPVLVVERVGPVDAVQRSLSILRKTWGEALGANFGIGFISFLAVLTLGIAPIVAGVIAIAYGHPAFGGILAAGGLLGFVLASLISSALNSIVLAALYLFAAEGKVPDSFDNALLEHAFARQ